MDDEDPVRLKHGRDAPPELVRALEALRTGTDETARLERVGAKLGPLLDAPPAPLSGAAQGAGAASYKLVLKLIGGGLALLVPALFLMRGDSAKPSSAAPSEQRPSLPQPEVQVNQPEPVAPPPAAEPAAPRAVPADPRLPRGGVSGATKSRSRGARPVGAAPQAAEAAAGPAVQSQPRPPAAETEPETKTEAEPKPQTEPEAEKTEPPTKPRARSETELLLTARKALPDDAALALRLLSEHEARFPGGQFAPEREVLAIEALRSLGRKSEADARLHRFEARYPDSFHLQRLKR